MKTAEDYRDILSNWRATAPANDSDILLPPARPTSSPRHGALAAELNVLLRWHALRNPEPQGGSNWSVTPANDNEPLAAKDHWRTREMRPTENEMQAAWAGVEFEERRDPVLQDGQRAFRTRLVPAAGDIERGDERYAKRPLKGFKWAPVTRLGDLEFSGLDFHKRKKQLQPLGSLTRCRGREPEERLTRAHQAGIPAEDVRASNRHVADIFGAVLPRYIPGKRRKRKPAQKFKWAIDTTSLTFAEAREWCGLPPAERNPSPVLPAGHRDIAAQFVGLKVRGSDVPAISGMPDASTPVLDAVENADTMTRLQKMLTPEDIKALDAAIIAPNFSEVGSVFGFEGKTAERRGKSIVIAAAEKLTAALENIAA